MTTFSKSIIIPSKVLLFGEYTILQGSDALAIPYPALSASWKEGGSPRQQQLLVEFATALKKLSLPFEIKTDLLLKDLEAGWYLESSIPQGYGLGSSAAVVAAVVEKYGEAYLETDLETLHQALATIESFFHGASSGTDPLVCLMKKPILIKNGGKVEVLNPFNLPIGATHVFLIDSGQSRETGSLVSLYKNKIKEAGFRAVLRDQLVPAQSNAIQHFLKGNTKELMQEVKIISELQFRFFHEMILEDQVPLWENALKNDHYFLKLCGAGGGGFLLAFSRDEKPGFPFPSQKISFDF